MEQACFAGIFKWMDADNTGKFPALMLRITAVWGYMKHSAEIGNSGP
jgi:hypothetical protein